MKEYHKDVNLKNLESGFVEEQDYITAHKNTVITCHDVIIKYKGGILLVRRDNLPGKGDYYVVGGRMLRGVPVEISLKKKVKEECGLNITNLQVIGCDRILFNEDPFNHGKGTDTFAVVYFADGEGELKLDKLHDNYKVITPKDDISSFPQYTQDLVRKGFSML